MESYISPVNYSIFIILYITSFVYIYTKYSEIVGLGALTVIQLGFTLFFGKELSQVLLNHPGGLNTLNFASLMTLHGSLISMVLLTTALILTTLTIIDIQEKYNDTKGTPIELPPSYQTLFDTIKRNTIIILALTGFLLCMYYFNKQGVNVQIMPIISNFTIGSLTNNIPAITNLVGSIAMLILSSYQVKYASDFSKLKKYSLIGR
tara:strand:+ start:4621 stop:5238 length:618 start_codon:yes stop_codon:yes gene_type:complete